MTKDQRGKTKLSDLKDSLLQSLEERGGLSLKIKLKLCFCIKIEAAPVVKFTNFF
jgi:hypothetical protein